VTGAGLYVCYGSMGKTRSLEFTELGSIAYKQGVFKILNITLVIMYHPSDIYKTLRETLLSDECYSAVLP